MRIVLDTNILARALPESVGPAREVLRRCCELPHILVTSPFILGELWRVLRCPRLRALHGLSDEDISDFIRAVANAAAVVNIPITGSELAISNDPNDDPIIATAMAGKAEVVCTLDRHLRNPEVVAHCLARGIRMLTDVQLLEALKTINNEHAESAN